MPVTIEKLSEIFKAVGEPNRLKILLMLKKREMCVCELVEILPISFPTISSHLKYLQKMGFLKKRREGKWIIYSLKEGVLVSEIVEFASNFLKNERDIKRIYKKLDIIDRNYCSRKYREK